MLTPHQRAVLVALTLNDVPIDVLAERRDTTRGALYKTLHDARHRLRARWRRTGSRSSRRTQVGRHEQIARDNGAPPSEGDPMITRIAINGFGRIGRAVLRSAIERDAELDVVAVNDVTDADAIAQLLRLDSVYGHFPHSVRTRDGAIEVAGQQIKVLTDHDSGALPPWGELGVDVVIEATGRFRTRADAARHIQAGARKVILSAPAKGPEPVDAISCSGSTSTRSMTPSATTSSAMSRALRTALLRWRRCSTRASASGMA
jgi:threonine dehydrogenase-like Zn-dependent dehydrogenase